MAGIDHAEIHRTQRDRLLALLVDLAWHSYAELHRVVGIRYGARLLELKRLGYLIEDVPHGEDGKQYRLVSPTPGVPRTKRVKVLFPLHDALILLHECRPTPDALAALRDAVHSFQHNQDKL